MNGIVTQKMLVIFSMKTMFQDHEISTSIGFCYPESLLCSAGVTVCLFVCLSVYKCVFVRGFVQSHLRNGSAKMSAIPDAMECISNS